MAETTEAAPIQTEAAPTSEAVATSLLTSTESAATDQQQSEAPKTADAEAKPADGTKTNEATPQGAPEKYEFKAPEGKDYDPAVVDTFSAAAKQANLTQDAAQKLLETMAPALAERQSKQVETVQNGWLEASRTDKEFGGDKLQENLSVAKSALEKFASPELKTLLTSTGLGNNAEVIRLLFRVGKATSEDTFVAGRVGESAPRQIKDVLYDNSKTGA